MSDNISTDSEPQQRAKPKKLRRVTWPFYAFVICLSLAAAGARLRSAPALQSANDRSRWCTVWSLVERGTYQIDEIRTRPGWDTIDLVKHEDHFYSTKPPLFPTVVAGVYWCVKQTVGWDLGTHTQATSALILVIVNLIPMAIALTCWAGILHCFARRDLTRITLMLMAAMGTLLTPFLLTLNNHTVAATSLMILLYPLLRIVGDGSRSPWHFLSVGFFSAWTCCNELPAAGFGVMVFLLLAACDLRRTLIYFVPAALIPLIGFFVTNYYATGGWKPFYLFYGTEKYVFTHEGIPSYWSNPRGIDRAGESFETYLFHCTVGHHGLLSLTPFYLLSLLGWLAIPFLKRTGMTAVNVVGLLNFLLVFAFYMTKTENYNYGGVSVALRWLLWLTPFLLLATVPLLDKFRKHALVVGLLCLLGGGSTFSAWYPTSTPWTHPWIYEECVKRGWIDYTERPAPFDRQFHCWIHQLPEGPLDEDYWVEFVHSEELVVVTLRISDNGPLERRNRSLRSLKFQERKDTGETREWTLDLDIEQFNAGAMPEDIISWPSDPPEKSFRFQMYRFLRALPANRPYSPGFETYVKTSFQKDALACKRAASAINENRPVAAYPTTRRHRCDLLLCEQVPFGVLKREITITERGTGSVQYNQTAHALRVGKLLPELAESQLAE